MNRCIYLRGKSSNQKFSSEEHVFPRCIGGTKKIHKGMVSDEFNNAISKAEKEFAQLYPLVILPRMKYGPQGRKKHLGIFSVGFLQYEGLDFLQIGYIENGEIINIPQVVVKVDDNKKITNITFVTEKDDDEITCLKNWVDYTNDIELINTNNALINNQIIIGEINKKLYVGTSEKLNKNTIHHYIDELINIIKNNRIKKTIKETNGSINYAKHTSFSMVNISRVFAKIVFNVLAIEKGHNFVLRDDFNNIADAITTGKGIMKYVSFPECNVSKELASFLKISNNEHFVFIKKEENYLTGVISLYGGLSSVMVILSNDWSEKFESCGYICDWKNSIDMSLNDYIVKKLLIDRDKN